MSSSDDGEYGINVWGAFTGAFGMLMVIPMLWSVVQGQLPPAKFKRLEQTLVDTETLLRCIIEEGLQLNDMPHYEGNLNKFRSSTERIREETYRATTFGQQVGAWVDGLSSRIGVLCDQIQDVRASICESSAEARAQLSAGEEVVIPVRHGLLSRLRRKLRYALAFVLGKSATVSVAKPAATPGSVSSPLELACAQAVSQDDARTQGSSTPPQSHTEPEHGVNVAPTAGTMPTKKHIRQVVRAIGCLEQDMVAHPVYNVVLGKIVQAAKRQRSVLGSTRSFGFRSTRRSRKARALVVPSRAVTQVVVLPQTSEDQDESDAESWEDDSLVVFGQETHII